MQKPDFGTLLQINLKNIYNLKNKQKIKISLSKTATSLLNQQGHVGRQSDNSYLQVSNKLFQG